MKNHAVRIIPRLFIIITFYNFYIISGTASQLRWMVHLNHNRVE